MVSNASPKVEVHPDDWRYGRYCTTLTAELSVGPDGVDEALNTLGYDVIDADQWGRSYRGPTCSHSVEVDDQDDPYHPVRLVMRIGDLSADTIGQASDNLQRCYARLQAHLLTQPADVDYDLLDDSPAYRDLAFDHSAESGYRGSQCCMCPYSSCSLPSHP